MYSLFEDVGVLHARSFHKKSSLDNKLAKSPMGVGFFFFAWLKKISGKKPHPPWHFSRDTPVGIHYLVTTLK